MPTLDTQCITLWPHQTAAIDAAATAINRGKTAGLPVMPTAAGKTVAFATLAARLGWPTLILVHRDELVGQTVGTFADVWPDASIGVVKGTCDEWADGQRVVIASVQSLHNGRLVRMPRDRFDLVVADEAHHSVAATWRAVVEHFEYRFLLGTTATPERADGQGLADLFGPEPLYVYPLRQAIEDGVLCRLTQYAVSTGASVDGVATRLGDFAVNELSHAVNTPARNRVVVEAFQEYASDRRGVAFTVDVAHAHNLADAFDSAGITSAVVSGQTPLDERRDTLARFRAGDIRVVTNCAVLTEGFDDPAVACILMARPTKSRPLYTQSIGRGLRRHNGKTDCLILDFADNSQRHKLVTVLDLFGTPSLADARGQDVVEVVDADMHEQEARHAVETLSPLSWRLERVCPWPELPSLRGYAPSADWHLQRATDKQLGFLRKLGLDTSRGVTKGEASYLIDRALEFQARYPSPPTSKQEWYLRHRGMWRDDMSFNEARQLIGQLKTAERAA